jgi:hypothetical protein
MAVLAVRLGSVVWHMAALLHHVQIVRGHRSDHKMIRVDALAVVAQVHHHKAAWNRSVCQLPRQAVRQVPNDSTAV